MKIAVIGTGSIGKRHLKTLSAIKSSEKIDEIRCYDKSPERVNEAIQKIENVTPCKKLAEAVNDVDIVFLCVPTSLHYAVWSDIKQIGDFHFFIEKPLSHSYENCDEMIFHHNRSGKHAMVGYMLRLHPLLLRAREIIQNETTLGRVLSVRSECGFYLPFWHPWEDYRDFYMSWKTGGGGALLDISHEIDYLMWLFGDISHVQGYSLTISDLEITSDDYVSSIFEFKNGIMGELHLDLLQPEESRSMKVIGTKGVMIADLMTNTIKYNTVENPEWITEAFEVDWDKVYEEEDSNVIKCVRGEESITTDIEQGAKVMQFIEAIRQSSANGSRIRLPLHG